MSYCIIPCVNGVPQAGNTRIIMAVSIDRLVAYAQIEGERQPEWEEIDEAEFWDYINGMEGQNG